MAVKFEVWTLPLTGKRVTVKTTSNGTKSLSKRYNRHAKINWPHKSLRGLGNPDSVYQQFIALDR